ATLTDAQEADMMAGKWYVNVHTANNKGGEIRGQLTK
ncbi:MAG: CHRD domain-containing protein, partial [Pseudolabrys sp.]